MPENVTAITEVFADGQKVTAAIIEYAHGIDNVKLLKTQYAVEGRTITAVYANSKPELTSEGRDGKYVILELDPEDTLACTIVQNSTGEVKVQPAQVNVRQVEDIWTVTGATYSATGDVLVNNTQINLVVDDFIEQNFWDLKTGQFLRYSLFIPEHYSADKSYPLVVFIHDRGVCSPTQSLGLVQGLGGVIWASPAEQAKRECFVLVPHYAEAIVNDRFETTMHFDLTVDLINSITNHYSINKQRLYATGQSMGCMSMLEMNIKYPHMFAAALLRAGQWNPDTISAIAENNVWVLVSEGDDRAFNGMNACMSSLESVGAKISRAVWNARASEADQADVVQAMIAESKNIKYTMFENGTVVPEDEKDDPTIPDMLKNHMHTWKLVYKIESLRDWLFSHEKAN